MSGAGYVFKTLKEHRGSYFVQYTPVQTGYRFASLVLVFLEKPIREEIPAIMEQECKVWIQRYPVPLMTTACDDNDDVISLGDEIGCNYLFALPEKDTVAFHWRMLRDDEFSSGAWEENRLLEIYKDVPWTTQAERSQNAASFSRSIRLSLVIIALWTVMVPVAVTLVGFASPILGWLIIIYSVSKAVWEALKMLGYVSRSKREKRKDEEELRMKHHHYHCERNPEGFKRLKAENFERDTREQTHREAEELKRLQSSEGGEP